MNKTKWPYGLNCTPILRWIRWPFQSSRALIGLLLGLVATPSLAQPYGLNQRLPIGPFLDNAIPSQPQSASWSAVVAFPSVTFRRPVYLAEPNPPAANAVIRVGNSRHGPGNGLPPVRRRPAARIGWVMV